MPLLAIDNLTVAYPQKGKAVEALKSFSCSLESGEAVGLIGESGCGKTTLALSILNLLDRRAEVKEGKVAFKGQNLLGLSHKQMSKIRGKEIALIPQASQHAFNPVLTVGHQLVEHLCWHQSLSKQEAVEKAKKLLLEMGLNEKALSSYPHQLSGGMRQRVAIAMAVALEPKLIIADECTNSLDVFNQEQIINLFNKIRQEGKITLLIISHDLGVIARTCQKIMVIYQGKLVEMGTTQEVLHSPVHPYTQKLLKSFITLNRRKES